MANTSKQSMGEESMKKPRGFAAMSAEDRRRYAREGGLKSSGKFQKGSQRAKEAGRRGGRK